MKRSTMLFLLCAFSFSFAQPETIDTIGTGKSASDSNATANIVFGSLTITSSPAEATVLCDAVERGVTPCTIDSLSPGTHAILVKKKGYFAKKFSVEIAASQNASVEVTLAKPQRFAITTTPAGAALELDGKPAGKTPFEDTALKNGSHTYRLTLADYAPIKDSLVVNSDTTVAITLVRSAEYLKAQQKSKDSRTMVSLIVTGSVFLVFIAILGIVDLTQP